MALIAFRTRNRLSENLMHAVRLFTVGSCTQLVPRLFRVAESDALSTAENYALGLEHESNVDIWFNRLVPNPDPIGFGRPLARLATVPSVPLNPASNFRIRLQELVRLVRTHIAQELGRLAAGPAPTNSSRPDHPWHVAFQAAVADADAVMADILRCVFGNPFRPPPEFDPAWRTSTVLGVAAGIDESRTFGNLPVLADALEDAGCDDTAILSHCRATAHHARGCWVLEGVLRPPTG